MKIINKRRFTIMFSLVIMCSLAACKKNGYLTDGGLAVAATPFSTYDYLKNNQYHQFDTVITLIDHYKLKDTINSAKTFFAFTDINVHQLMKSLVIKTLDKNGDTIRTPVTTLSQLTDSISSRLFKQYIFGQTITLDNATLSPVLYTNMMGAVAPCAIKKTATVQYVYLTNSTQAFTYYTLQYMKINGVLDGSAGAPADDPVDFSLSCQTTGVQTSTGTTLHVLSNNATLNKL